MALFKYFIVGIMLIAYISAVNSQLCLPIDRDCSFYTRCLEEKVPCGPNGYALGFGLIYCQKFNAHNSMFSAKGREWLWSTMKCLQNVLIPVANGQVRMTCDDIHTFAFASHPICYTQPGQSICNLPLTDWTMLFVMIIEQLKDPATWAQMLEVLSICNSRSNSGNIWQLPRSLTA